MAPRKRSMSFVVNDATNVRVYVRVRPFNSRERDSGILKPAVRCEGKVAYMYDVETEQPKEERFTFDECYWSNNDHKSTNPFATQSTIYSEVGSALLDNAFKGYHACLFAYGQTGSGKTFTMMGDRSNPELWGMIPRLCNGLFERIEMEKQNGTSKVFKVEVGYIEIYNELLKDLLGSNKGFCDVKIRDHPVYGPTVEGNQLAKCANLDDINKVMGQGDHRRTVAATAMNATSSRSHAVFTVMFTQDQSEDRNGKTVKQTWFSKINLIDLAGSERVEDSGVSGAQFKEAVNINKSLTTLGRVMDALVELSQGKKGIIPPYRESVLTRTLQDSLGGNSKTMMFANVSPSPLNFEETLSTLRYSSRARNIVNTAKVNTQSSAGAASLQLETQQSEIDELRKQLEEAQKAPKIQAELDQVNSELENARQEYSSADAKLHSAMSEANDYNTQVKMLQNKKSELSEKAARLVEVEAEKARLERERSGLNTDTQKLQAEVKRLQGIETNHTKQIGSQGGELKKLKEELDELKRTAESTKSKLTREGEEKTASLEDSRKKRDRLEEQLTALQSDYERLKDHTEQSDKELKDINQQREELRAEKAKLEAKCQQQAKEIAGFEADIAAERKKSSDYLMNLVQIEDSVNRKPIKVPTSGGW